MSRRLCSSWLDRKASERHVPYLCCTVHWPIKALYIIYCHTKYPLGKESLKQKIFADCCRIANCVNCRKSSTLLYFVFKNSFRWEEWTRSHGIVEEKGNVFCFTYTLPYSKAGLLNCCLFKIHFKRFLDWDEWKLISRRDTEELCFGIFIKSSLLQRKFCWIMSTRTKIQTSVHG